MNFVKTMWSKYNLTAFLYIFVNVLSAQDNSILWEQTYDAGYFEYTESVIEDSDSCLLICGNSYNTATYDENILLIKTDNLGSLLWQKIYGGERSDVARSVFQPDDSCYLVIGNTNSFKNSIDDHDIFILKLTLEGDTLWTKSVGTDSTSEKAFSSIITSDDNILVVGMEYSISDFIQKMLLIKMDQNGNVIWKKTYGGGIAETGQCVIETANGFLIAGETSSFGTGTPFYTNIYLVKTDSNGDSLWTRFYGHTWFDYSRSIIKTGDNNYIVAGWFATNGSEVSDFYALKIEANGDTAWTKLYGGIGYDYCYNIVKTGENEFLLIGNTNSIGAGSYDMFLVSINADGDTIYTKTIGTSIYESAKGALKTSDGNYLIYGTRKPHSVSNSSDILLVKIDLNIFSNITEPKNSFSSDFILRQNYPNPFNNSTIFEIAVSEKGALQLQIFDITGKEVYEKNIGNVIPAVHKIQWNGLSNSGTQIASGVYFYRYIFTGKNGLRNIQTRKMMLLR